MTARYQLALLDLSTPGGVSMRRWHSRHGWGDVTWESVIWSFTPFDHAGISAGAMADAASSDLSFPRLPTQEAILRQAHRESWRGRLRILHWPEADEAGTAPPAEPFVVATMRGVLSLGEISLTTIQARLDSSLLAGSGGGRFPPRLATTAMIGIPVVLGSR